MAEWNVAMSRGFARSLRDSVNKMDLHDPLRYINLTTEEENQLKGSARQALVNILGFDLGEDPQVWREWLDEHEDELDQYIDLSDSGDDDKYSL